jgi:hypothetical protein
VLVTAGLPKLAISQESKPNLSQEPSSQPANLDENQLKSFAKVYVEVEKISQSYGPRLKEAQDPDQTKQIQAEAKTKIDEALTNGGFTVTSYTQAFQTVNGNDELRKKVIQLINEERKKS